MTGMETVRAQPWERPLGGGAAALRRAERGDDAEEGCAASAAMMETQVFMAVRSGATQLPTEESATVSRHRAPVRRMVTMVCAG